MKRFLPALLLAAALLCGCASSYKNIKVTDCKLHSVTPTGLRSLDAILVLTVDNPASDLIIRDAQGMVKRNGENFLRINASDIFVEGKCTKDYKVPLGGELLGEGGVLSLFSSMTGSAQSDYTVDIVALISLKSGLKHNFEFKDVPMEDLLKLF
ncbi:MAG: hypothetical protein IJS62_08500 [Bacteroidales bacterium]|nr:hypothetical protein [Bacteroidales bacterium]